MASRLVLALGALWLSATAAAAAERTTLAMPAVTIGFLAEYVAEDMQFWTKRGLDVDTQFISGIGAMNAVIAGSADFSFSSGASITRAAAHGQKLLTIASLNDAPGEHVVLRADLAQSLKFDPKAPLADRARVLKGLRFAIGGVNTISDAYLKVVAREAGLAPGDLVTAPMQPPDTLAALSRKAIDGFSLGEPWPEAAAAQGLGVVVADGREPKKYLPFSSAILVTRANFCTERRSVCEAMGRGLVDAIQFIDAHRDETIVLMKKRFPALGDAVLAASFDVVRSELPNPPVTTVAGLANADRMNADAGFAQGGEPPDYATLFDNEFVQ